MLICTPTSDAGGLDAKIHNHFGSAPYFTLYNTETEEIQIIENRNTHHSHGTCHPLNQLNKYKIDVVLCNGMGRRAVEALNYEGIRTVGTDTSNLTEALKLLAEDKLSDFDPSRACHGHGHGQKAASFEIEQPDDFDNDSSKRGNGKGCQHSHGNQHNGQ